MTDLDVIDPSARELLRAWGRASLPDDRLRRVGEQLFAVQGATPTTGAPSALRKIIGGLLGAGVAALVLAAVARPNEDPRRTSSAFATVPELVAAPVVLPPIAAPPVPIVIASEAGATTPARPTKRKRADSDPLAAEIALVDRIEAQLLAQAPEQALRLADRHGRRFPAGVFRDEVSVLRADALCRLGERERARRVVDDFTASHIGSPLVRRMSSICR